jgi:hypothetical protein
VKRRDVLKVIGLGGILPFIRHEEVEAAPLEVPLAVQPQPNPYAINRAPSQSYMGTGGYAYRSLAGVSGSVSFSTDGVNWRELGKLTSIDFGGDE